MDPHELDILGQCELGPRRAPPFVAQFPGVIRVGEASAAMRGRFRGTAERAFARYGGRDVEGGIWRIGRAAAQLPAPSARVFRGPAQIGIAKSVGMEK